MPMIGEYGDQYIHTTQTESFIDNFNYEITPKTSDTPEIRTRNDNAVNFNKIYLEPYDNVDNLQATREKLVEDFRDRISYSSWGTPTFHRSPNRPC